MDVRDFMVTLLLLYLTKYGHSTDEFMAGPVEPEIFERTETHGSLQSPSLHFVDQPKAFVWSIKPFENVIVLKITRFNIPRSESCSVAYLDIFGGPISISKRVTKRKLCGKLSERKFLVKSREANVVYFTSKPNRAKGFKLAWGKNSYSECGTSHVTPVSLQKLGSGHVTSTEGTWPWMAAVMRDSKFYCHGVILNQRFILAATSCLQGIQVTRIQVIVGKHVIGFREPSEQTFAVTKTVSVPYDDDDVVDEFAMSLLHLDDDVTFTPYVRPACLPPLRYKHDEKVTCFTVGWELEGRNDIKTKVGALREIEAETESDEVCEERLKQGNISSSLASFSYISAISTISGEAADTGHPLLCYVGKRWAVVGLMKAKIIQETRNSSVFIYKKVQDHLESLENLTGINIPLRFYGEDD